MSRAEYFNDRLNESFLTRLWFKVRYKVLITTFLEHSQNVKYALAAFETTLKSVKVRVSVKPDTTVLLISIYGKDPFNLSDNKRVSLAFNAADNIMTDIDKFFVTRYKIDLVNEEVGLQKQSIEMYSEFKNPVIIKNPGQYAVHATKRIYARKILKDGLKPAKEENKVSGAMAYRTNDRIFMFTEKVSEKMAYFYATHVLDIKNPVFLRIDLSKLPKETIFYKDMSSDVPAMYIEGVAIPAHALDPFDLKFKRIRTDPDVWAEYGGYEERDKG